MLKKITRGSTKICEFLLIPCIVTCLYGLLFKLLGVWKELWSLLKDPSFGVVLLAMIALFTFIGLVQFSSDYIVELGRKKRFLCSKGNPVDKSGLIVLVVMCFMLVISVVIFFSR